MRGSLDEILYEVRGITIGWMDSGIEVGLKLKLNVNVRRGAIQGM